MLLLNASLSFDSAEFLSRHFKGFKSTLSILLSRLCDWYWPKVQLLSHLSTLLFTVSQQRPYLISLSRTARREGRTTFNCQSWCCEIRSRGPPEAQYFRGFVGITSYWNWILLDCHSKNFAEAEERVWGHYLNRISY